MVDVSETGFCSPAAAAVHPGDGPAADSAMHHALVALGFRELPRNPGRCGGKRGHDRHAESPGTGAGARQSDIPGISIEMMAIDHSDASALVEVRRTSSAAVRQATASAVNRYCPPASSSAGKSPRSAGSRYRRSVASPERRFRHAHGPALVQAEVNDPLGSDGGPSFIVR